MSTFLLFPSTNCDQVWSCVIAGKKVREVNCRCVVIKACITNTHLVSRAVNSNLVRYQPMY